MSNKITLSARTFATIVARSGSSHIARELGCTEAAVRGWASGRRSPEPTWRSRLAAFDPRLDVDGWDAPAPKAAPSKRSSPVSAGTAVSSLPVAASDEAGGEAGLLAVIDQCDRLFMEASDPDAHVSVRDKTAILAAKSSAVIRLSRVRGEDAVSMQKILDSRWWKEIERVFAEEVVTAGGDVAAALGKRLRAMAAAESD